MAMKKSATSASVGLPAVFPKQAAAISPNNAARMTAPGAVKAGTSGSTSKQPIPAPNKSEKYNLLTCEGRRDSNSATTNPEKKNGTANAM